MLKVFNVGQGDSLLLRPDARCKFDTLPLLVDTGPSVAKVADRLDDERLAVLITHSHADHIGGLPRLLRKRDVSELFIPYYLPEITRINRYLQRFSNHKLKELNWQRLKKKIRLVADGDALCNHLVVMNPPRDPGRFVFMNQGSELEIGQALNLLNNLGLELPRDEIENYRTPIFSPEQPGQEDNQYTFLARRFIHRFFISLGESLQRQGRVAIPYEVNRHIELTANQASIVFRYVRDKEAWLFTGDADETVFDRLISEGKDISAKYLKVPHHGSRGNMTREILRKINPQFAIVSHNNKSFGRSLDPHPHHEILDLLDQFGVRTYYTNPVIKKKLIIKPAMVGTTPDKLITFA